jgi:hypothetical protein
MDFPKEDTYSVSAMGEAGVVMLVEDPERPLDFFVLVDDSGEDHLFPVGSPCPSSDDMYVTWLTLALGSFPVALWEVEGGSLSTVYVCEQSTQHIKGKGTTVY